MGDGEGKDVAGPVGPLGDWDVYSLPCLVERPSPPSQKNRQGLSARQLSRGGGVGMANRLVYFYAGPQSWLWPPARPDSELICPSLCQTSVLEGGEGGSEGVL